MLLYDFVAGYVQLSVLVADGPPPEFFAEGGFADFLAGAVGFGIFGSADDFVHGDGSLGKRFVEQEEWAEGSSLELEGSRILLYIEFGRGLASIGVRAWRWFCRTSLRSD